MSSNQSSHHGSNSKKPGDDLESEETLSLCDLVICDKNTDDNYQYFSKEEEDFFEFFTTDLETNTKAYSPEKIVFGGKLISFEAKQKPKSLKENLWKRKLVKHDSVGSSSSRRQTNLLLILLGIPPKTQTEKEIMVDIRNRQSHHGPSTFFESYRDSDKKVVHHPRVKRGFWRAVNVASCFGGQFVQSQIL
ncbi:hypothetical protein POM88_048729 [Heracleum sosnowskyi]|uniref:Uncharacterized protein n=1 Tax=Heracleum sosnowskyi TaxID=360622 RepID=A0AAD8M0Z3_9APIA|nr:hypothetical protein POM88_048729 [Heracleum sosnowskyi]